MKKRFTEEQIIQFLKEPQASKRTADVYRRHGISQPTFDKWKAKFGGMDLSDARGLKSPEAENTWLKKRWWLRRWWITPCEGRKLTKELAPDAKREAESYL